jgi:2-octaprenyl-6-methoxyphenol hydroxylase
MMKQFDIIIAGGGMVGATAGLALAELGLSIALIESVSPEQPNSTSFDQRAVALSEASVRIFKSLGVWQSIQPFAESIKQIHVSDKGKFGFTRIKAQDYSLDALGEVIPLDQTGPILWQLLSQRSNVQLFSGYDLVNIDSSNEKAALNAQAKVTVEIINKIDASSVQLAGQLLLGADGTFSSVAKMAAIDSQTRDYQQHAIITNIATEVDHQNRAYERFTASGPLALLPLTQNRMSLVWCKKADEYQDLIAADDQSFIRQLQHEFGYRLGQITKVGQRVHYPLNLKVVPKPFKPGILLLGNAAHTLHPIAGQGFNIGLRDVAALADSIEIAMQSSDSDFSSENFLQGYQKSRQQDWNSTISATDWLVRIFSQSFMPLVFARDKAMNITNKIPFFKQQLAYAAMGLAGKSAKLTRGIKTRAVSHLAKGSK